MTDYGDPNPTGPGEGEKWLADAVRSVRSPGAALQWYGMLAVLLAVIQLVVFLASPDSFYKPIYDEMVKAQRDQPGGKPLPPYKKFVEGYQLPILVGSIVDLGAGFVIAIGGLKMKQMSGYGWAMAGSVLAAIPCSSSCFCIGLPVGMWALVVLFGSDVKRAFARITAMGGLDAYDPGAQDINRPPTGPV